jgi:hypothetical protein
LTGDHHLERLSERYDREFPKKLTLKQSATLRDLTRDGMMQHVLTDGVRSNELKDTDWDEEDLRRLTEASTLSPIGR